MNAVTNMRVGRATIGALSNATGCKVETIRFYERIGLMPKPQRSEGGHRLYDNEQLKRLNFIRRSRELGFALDDVRELLRFVDGHNVTCGEVRTMTLKHRDDVHRKIADLKRIDRVLMKMASDCDGGGVPECPIIDALFQGRAFENAKNTLVLRPRDI